MHTHVTFDYLKFFRLVPQGIHEFILAKSSFGFFLLPHFAYDITSIVQFVKGYGLTCCFVVNSIRNVKPTSPSNRSFITFKSAL